jgi:glycosyltransferase involved in cell wall biosynthesis
VEHSSSPWGQRALLGKLVRRILTIRKTSWVSVASHLTIWPTGTNPSAILQNPIAPHTQLQSETVDEEIERLVFIGRLSREKRPDFALEISRRTAIGLEIIGDGVLRADLEKKSLQERIGVCFHGQIEDPWSQIRSGDLLIVPSAFEGDGLVIIEGLQHQVPMLLADIPDLRRFGFPDANYCVDIDAFTVQIKNFRSKLKDLLVPSEISNSILKFRSIDTVGSSWEKFFGVL